MRVWTCGTGIPSSWGRHLVPGVGSRRRTRVGILPNWFFFYGTLMDRDVLAHVVDREVADDELFPAILHGVRRVAVPGFTYPRLVDAPGRLAAGLALHRPSPRDLVRLHWFE